MDREEIVIIPYIKKEDGWTLSDDVVGNMVRARRCNRTIKEHKLGFYHGFGQCIANTQQEVSRSLQNIDTTKGYLSGNSIAAKLNRIIARGWSFFMPRKLKDFKLYFDFLAHRYVGWTVLERGTDRFSRKLSTFTKSQSQ